MKRTGMWFGIVAGGLCLLAFAATPPTTAEAAPPAVFKNLQVLPKTITKDELKKIMKAQAKALGVECDFCHDQGDMSADGKKEKKLGREMMRMVGDLNKRYFSGGALSKKPVGCVTCHQGKKEPPSPQP